MPRRSTIIVAALVASATPATAWSQRVTGVVRDTAAGAPLAGAVVSLIGPGGATSARTTADVNGRYSLPRPAFAADLRAIRIGFRPAGVALPAATSMRDTTVDLALGRVPPILATVRVSDHAVCSSGNDRGAAFDLWDQARAGLMASTVSRDVNPGAATTVIFRRRLSPTDNAVRSETQELRRGQSSKPFVAAIAAAALARDGFMTEDSTGRTFYGPDESVLLDESFAATHCFRLQSGDAQHNAQIGLAFEPAPGRDSLVDVTGVIWMDASPLGLRSLDFEFTGLEPAAARANPGGHIEFRQTARGIPLAASWSLRLPRLIYAAGAAPSVLQRPMAKGRARRTDLRLTEVEETTAEVLEMVWPDSTIFRAETTGVVGRATRVAGDADSRASYAVVKVDETSTTAVADGTGDFVLTPMLPGHYRITVVDTALAAFVNERSTTVSVDVRPGQLTPVGLQLPAIARSAAAACKRSGSATGGDVFGRLTWPSTSHEVPRLRVSMELSADSAADRYAPIDDRGNFRLCDIPLRTPATLHVRVGTLEADTTVTLTDALVTSFLWQPTYAVTVAARAPRSVRGVVLDSGAHPMRDVSVSARGHGSVTTNQAGRFRFELPAGAGVVLDARRVGYMPTQYTLGAGDDTSITVTMLPAVQELAAVEVTAREAGALRSAGYEERLKNRLHTTTTGFFITAEDIERRHGATTTSLFNEVPNMRVLSVGRSAPGAAIFIRGGFNALFGITPRLGVLCNPAVFIDGVRIPPDMSIDDLIQPGEIKGIEAYPSANAAPAQYQRLNGGCAVVLIWQK